MGLRKAQRQHLSAILSELTNLIAAAVVVAGLIEKTASLVLVTGVLTFYVVVAVMTTALRREG